MQNKTFTREYRKCCVCDKTLIGRSDKVFCNIQCKNFYHSEMRKHTKTAASETMKIMIRNYEIICVLFGDNPDRVTIKKLALEKMGFKFEVVSGVERNVYGLKMNVFEFSWFYGSKSNIVLLKDKEESKISPFVYKRWNRHYRPLQTDS